jgi:hypothetical protein
MPSILVEIRLEKSRIMENEEWLYDPSHCSQGCGGEILLHGAGAPGKGRCSTMQKDFWSWLCWDGK